MRCAVRCHSELREGWEKWNEVAVPSSRGLPSPGAPTPTLRAVSLTSSGRCRGAGVLQTGTVPLPVVDACKCTVRPTE